jgi:hypothetical protein
MVQFLDRGDVKECFWPGGAVLGHELHFLELTTYRLPEVKDFRVRELAQRNRAEESHKYQVDDRKTDFRQVLCASICFRIKLYDWPFVVTTSSSPACTIWAVLLSGVLHRAAAHPHARHGARDSALSWPCNGIRCAECLGFFFLARLLACLLACF